MIDFEFHNPARIVFGRGAEDKVGALIKREGGSKVLLHYGGGSIKKNGLYDRVVRSLRDAGVAYCELGGVQPNPRLALVYRGIELCKAEGVDFVLAVGGGSVIDSAKAVAGGVASPKDIWEYYITDEPVTRALPLGAVLTIPAAGSESSPSSVITNEAEGLKRDAGGECIIPRFAVMDPEVTFSMPAYQIACGASDIVAHLMERYFTRVTAVDLTDRMIEAAVSTMLTAAPRAIERPTDYDVRAEIMWTGTVAHNNLLDTGRIGDWGSHSIEHELSARYDLAHGAGLAIVFPAWMKYVHRAYPEKFVQFGRRVFGVDFAPECGEQAIAETIARLEGWYRRIGLPVRLADIGVAKDADLKEMAAKCLYKRDHVGNLLPLKEKDVYEIYKLAL